MEDFTELIKAVTAYDWGRSGASLLDIDAEIRKIAGHAEHLAKLEAALRHFARCVPLGQKSGRFERGDVGAHGAGFLR